MLPNANRLEHPSIFVNQSVSHPLIHHWFKAALSKLLQLEPKEKFGVLMFKILVLKSNFVTCCQKYDKP